MMDSDKSLIDSLLKLDVSGGARSSGSESFGADDSRQDGNNDFLDHGVRSRRTSDAVNPPGSDSIKFSIMAPAGGAILDPSMDNNKESVRSPPRYGDASSGEYVAESFALGAIARFREGEENKMYPSAEPLHDDRAHLATRSRDGSGEASPYNREYQGYDSRSRSRSSSNPATRDLYPQNESGAPVRSQPPENPYLSQHGYTAPSGAIAQPGPSPSYAAPPTRTPTSAARTGSYQVYAPAPEPAPAPGPYGRPPPPSYNMPPPPQQEPYYAAPPPTDPYGYRPSYVKQPYAPPYRPQVAPAPYVPGPPDPYGGYGAPAPMPVPAYNPRYGKPMAPAYRQPYSREDPYYSGGGGAPYPYGYPAAPYAQAPPPQEDPYYGSAAAVNRALGRPIDGFRGGGGGGPRGGQMGGGYGNPINARLRDRALPPAEPVNLDTIDPSTIVYQVQFKKTIRNFTMRPGDMTPVKAGDFVVVQADRGEDLGIITESYSLPEFLEKRFAMRAYMDEEDQNVSYILRLASPAEMKLLPEKFQDEEMIFKTCENLAVHTYRLPMTVVDVEYQFDRHKITIYYDSPVRIDFRELVRDLFSSFKARIWMKKVNQFHPPNIKHYAAMALATGVHFAPTDD